MVPVQLIGNYYYDSIGQRECNVWVNALSGERTKVLCRYENRNVYVHANVLGAHIRECILRVTALALSVELFLSP